jgi:hypothetical protein
LYFTWNIRQEEDNLKEVELIPDGAKILLNEKNKQLFVDKV